MRIPATIVVPLFLHPMEKSLKHAGQVHEGLYSDTLGMKGIPRQAETIAVYRQVLGQ